MHVTMFGYACIYKDMTYQYVCLCMLVWVRDCEINSCTCKLLDILIKETNRTFKPKNKRSDKFLINDCTMPQFQIWQQCRQSSRLRVAKVSLNYRK